MSFPRKREPSQFNKLDSHFRGNDDLISVSVTVSGQTKASADIVLGRVKSNTQRIELIRELISASERAQKEYELNLVKQLVTATQLRNEYAHAIYSQVAASKTKWRMSMWLSDGQKRKKQFKDINVDVVKKDGEFIRNVLQSLFYFGSIEVAYE